MPSLVAKFIQQQLQIQDSIPAFVDSLEQSKTVTLAELLEEPFRNITWLDKDQLVRRLESAMRFFRGVSPRIPFVFLQIPDAEVHQSFHKAQLAAWPGYRKRFAKAGYEAHFLLHTKPLWTDRLVMTSSGRGMSIRPCSSFRSKDWDSLGADTLPRGACPQVLGYWLAPEYPTMLGVSPAVATDCLARMLIHDMGHFVLPNVAESKEPLYDVAMIAAMSVRPGEVPLAHGWEEIVHQHNTDPFFFLEALSRIHLDSRRVLTPLQSWLRNDMREYYAANGRMRRKLWNLPGKRKGRRAVSHVKQQIDTMWVTGFSECFA